MDNSSALSTINWLAVFLAAIVPFVSGFLWYGPLFGRTWMRLTGITEEQARGANMALTFGVAFVLQFVAAAVLAMFIGPDATLAFATMAAFSVGACWVATAYGVTYLFEQRPIALWATNAGYHVVTYTLMGVVLGLF